MHFLSASSVLQLGQVRMSCSAACGEGRGAVPAAGSASAPEDERRRSVVTTRIVARLPRCPLADILAF